MRRPRWLLAVVLGALAFGVTILLLFFVVFPSLPPGETKLGSRTYFVENEVVFGPSFSNFSFHGVLFGFHVWCGATDIGGARVCGNATEPGTATYPFSFWEPGGAPRASPSPWQSWVAPDGSEAVQFEPDSGGHVNLLVAV